MVAIIKVAAVGIVGAILAVTMQQQKREFALVLSIVAGVLLMQMGLSYLSQIVEGLREMAGEAGVSGEHLKLLFKLLAISYVVEFGSEVCKDAGQQALAAKVQLTGRLIMAALVLPVFRTLLSQITELLT